MNVTLLTQDGIGGSPELTSKPFTPVAGDTVLVVWARQSGGIQTITLAAPSYTWVYGPTFGSADGDVTMESAWAFNVPGGTVSFTTTGLVYSGMTYFVFDLGPVTAQDQVGEQYTPNPSGGSAALVTTAGPVAQTGEVAVAWQQTQYSVPATALPNWTTTQQQANTAFGPLNLVAAWNPSAGTAGVALTGGWSALTPGAGNAMILTFMGSPTPPPIGNQPGFPKSGEIEEPTEGIQQSNVTPPSMGPING